MGGNYVSEIAMNKKGKEKKIKNRENIFTIFRDGDLFTRLSFLIMGFANIAKKQIVKGLIYLGFEIGFICFMIFYLFFLALFIHSYFTHIVPSHSV